MKRYFEHYESKIAELFSTRTEIDKNNELRCKINAIEIESIVYQQTIKRKLEKTRNHAKRNLQAQFEVKSSLRTY